MIDLNSFFSSNLFQTENCWQKCGNSHCCTLYRLTNHLKFSPHNAIQIYLYPSELDFHLKNKTLDPQFEKTLKTYQYRYRDILIKYHTINCPYGGPCPDHAHRPLSCYFYPCLPQFDNKGQIIKLHNLSICDDLYDLADIKKPCVLYAQFTIEQYQKICDQYFNEEFYFYTNLYIRIKEKIVSSFGPMVESRELIDIFQLFEFHFSLNRKQLITQNDLHQFIDQERDNFKFP